MLDLKLQDQKIVVETKFNTITFKNIDRYEPGCFSMQYKFSSQVKKMPVEKANEILKDLLDKGGVIK